MTKEQYNSFLKTQYELQELLAKYAVLWLGVNGADSFGRMQFISNTAAFQWEWHGPYQSHDTGYAEVPIDVLLSSQGAWLPHIEAEYKREREEETARRAAETDARRRRQIEDAKRIIAEAGE